VVLGEGAGLFSVRGGDAEGDASGEGFVREDVEGPLGQDVDDEEIEVALFVRGRFGCAARNGDMVGSSGGALTRGFDLDAQATSAVIDDEVVTLLVAKRFGDDEAALGGLKEEGGFADFSDAVRGMVLFGHTSAFGFGSG